MANAVATLVAKSMLTADEASGSTRYQMLETLRTFARERLEDTGDLHESPRIGNGRRTNARQLPGEPGNVQQHAAHDEPAETQDQQQDRHRADSGPSAGRDPVVRR